jgi:hypothetical protein
MIISIKLSPKSQEIVNRLQTLPQEILRGIADGMFKASTTAKSNIQRDYLSYPRDEPTTPLGLRNVTGNYLRSLRAGESQIEGQRVISSIGSLVLSKSGVSYPSVHEFGADIPSRPTRSKNKYYAKKHPTTKAYRIGERAPIQHGVQDSVPYYNMNVSRGIKDTWAAMQGGVA